VAEAARRPAGAGRGRAGAQRPAGSAEARHARAGAQRPAGSAEARRGRAGARRPAGSAEARHARARAQLLHRPAGSAEAAVGHLLAVQAQDARAAGLALRARVPGFAGVAGDGLVTTWLMRGTLHTVRREDVHWLHALTAPRQLAANRRRLAQEGVDEAQAARAVQVLADAAPLQRDEAAALLGARGRALAHLVLRAAIEGAIALGPDRRIVALEPGPEVDRDAALAELARRYLAAHPGAGAEDLAYWSGLPLRDARAGLRDLSPPPAPPAGDVPLRLLGAFDELLLGWRDRTPVVAAEHARSVHPGGGILRAIVLEDGEARGTWSLRAGRVTFEPFAAIADTAALDAEIAAVEAYIKGQSL
jgi:Winged helix DNA-binding domain